MNKDIPYLKPMAGIVVIISLILYYFIRSYYIRLDDLGVNQGVSHMALIYYTMPGKIIEFNVAAYLSVLIVRKKRFPRALNYVLPILMVGLVFFLDLDFYHWSLRHYPMGYDGEYINRSIFWALFLK